MPLLLSVDKVCGKIRNEKYRYIADQKPEKRIWKIQHKKKGKINV